MANSIPNPPRFGTSNALPKSVAEGVQFIRWLYELWKKSNAAATDIDVLTWQRRPPSPLGADPTTLNAALLLSAARQTCVAKQQQDADLIARASAVQIKQNPAAQTADLAVLLGMRAPYRSGAQIASGLVLEDTHANRVANYPPNNYAVGTLFYETDRAVFYLNRGVSGSQFWAYADGVCACTQATLPAGLGANDSNFLANVFDYGHLLIWSGAAWTWGPGDAGSGMLQLFEVDPTGSGWHLYDGGTVNYLKSDGTLGSITLPNLSGAAPTRCYLKTSDTNAGPTAPTAPTFTGTGVTGLTFSGTVATLTGTVAAPVFSGTPATLTGTVAAPVFTGNALATHQHECSYGVGGGAVAFNQVFGSGGALTSTNVATAGASVVGFVGALTSSVSSGTPTGTNTAPALTMNAYTPAGTNTAPALTMNAYTPAGTLAGGTPTGTISATGEPENLTRRAWFRQ